MEGDVYKTGRHDCILYYNYFFRFVKNDRLIPFGIGKRVCMGELLARNEIFLFTVNLIQSIKFLPPVQNPIPSPSNYIVNLSRIPDDFYIRFEAT